METCRETGGWRTWLSWLSRCRAGRAGVGGSPGRGTFHSRVALPLPPCLLPLSLGPSLKPTSLPSIAQSGFEVSGSVILTKSPSLVGPGKGRDTGDSGAGLGRGLAGLGRGLAGVGRGLAGVGVGGAGGAAGRRLPAPWSGVTSVAGSPPPRISCSGESLPRSGLRVEAPAAPRDCGTGRAPRPAPPRQSWGRGDRPQPPAPAGLPSELSGAGANRMTQPLST